MEKRAFLAVILSLLVLLGYQYLFAPRVEEGPASISAAPEKASEPARSTVPGIAGVPSALPPQVQPDLPGKEITVETGTVRAVIDTKGGYIKSWTLKGYMDRVKGGAPVEMVPSGKGQLMLSLQEDEREAPDTLSYISDRESLKGAGSVTLSAIRPAGVRVAKTFTFQEDGYKARVRVNYENNTPSAITERPALTLSMLSKAEDRHILYHELAYLSGKDVERVYADKIKDEKAGSGEMEWAFLGDKYFMTAVIPPKGITDFYSKRVGEELYEGKLVSQPLHLMPGETAGLEYEIYFGPKEVDILKAAGSRLDRAIDLGFFDLLGYPLLLTFKWMYRVVPNYGIVIILLTVIIKLVFWPLSQKSYKSMKEMQKLAPLMEQLREKYKNDKERLNREVIELYRRYKVNPLGGCLPMLLQIPVFFALYTVLNGAVELRHAPFILWITDLSAKDPYYVTPILMGATMFIQQKMTPISVDPVQQKVMMIMPVVFTFLFLNFSSGLVLYWLVNNVLSIGQQYYVNKYMK
jgi:YidC/Oxa1 family membrane protein insertase